MTLPGMPTLALKCAFDTPPLSAGTFSYATVSSRLLGFTSDRGRGDELEPFKTGTGTFTLKDDDRALDPANSSGTYYGRLLPRRRWTLEATYGGTTYTVCDFHNRNWKPEWNAKHARHGLQMTDAFELFTNDTFSSSVILAGGGILEGEFVDRDAELTSDRIGWIADQTGWPSGRRTFDTGQVEAQAHTYIGHNALTGMRDTEVAEAGFLYMGTTGNLVFRSKYSRVGGSVQAVFGDQSTAATTHHYDVRLTTTNAGGSDAETKATYVAATGSTWTGEVPYTEWDYEPQDVDHIMNHVTGKLANGDDTTSVHEYNDSTSGTLNGHAAYTFELWADNDLEAEARTQYYVGRYSTPAIRVKSVTIKPRTDPARMWPIALGTPIGARVRVKQRFYGTGATLAHDAYVEGVRHDAAPGDWATTFSLSPVVSGQDNGSYFTLGTSILGTSTVLAW